MHVRQHRRLVNLLVRQVVAHTTNIVFDGAWEKALPLRQVAGKLAELPAIPITQLRVIQSEPCRLYG